MEIEAGQMKEGKKKGASALIEQWRLHSAGACGGERQGDDRVADSP